MADIPGIDRPDLLALPQIQDRMSFLYLEHCTINREDSAITAADKDGVTKIPAGVISVLMLGPGTNITHRAMELIGDAGVTVIWVGEKGVRYYGSGRALTHSSSLLQRQAAVVSNQRKHLEVVRQMYAMRFPGEDVSKLTLQQLRGREGARIRNLYKSLAKKWGIAWSGRDYDPDNYNASNDVNKALSVGNSCLYGLAHAVICALGCSPGLGFVHVGHDLSFVYDVADLYKAETSIPLAFETAAEKPDDIEQTVRRAMRDKFVTLKLQETMVRDIKNLLSLGVASKDEADDTTDDELALWDGKDSTVPNAKSYK